MSIYNEPNASLFIKANSLFGGTIRQLKHIIDAKSYDVVVVYREAMLWGKPWIEKQIVKQGLPLIHDFDDAIWLPVESETGISTFLKRILKSEKKFDEIIKLSTHVIVGNNYLAEHARLFNKNMSVIPTAVDTDYYRPRIEEQHNSKITIGWIGSGSTVKYLNLLDNVWKRLPENYELIIVGGYYSPEGMRINNIKWALDTELEQLSKFTIGIMPLPDDEWSRGKCGLKALQYMAMGIPCVASPVGVNTEIIQDGVNGFLAKDENEWIGKITLLMQNPDLRRKLGMAGRKTVEERYSVKVWAPKYIEIIKNVAEAKSKS